MFFLIRSLSFTLRQERELQLPLTRADECVSVDDVLDLSMCPVYWPSFALCDKDLEVCLIREGVLVCYL